MNQQINQVIQAMTVMVLPVAFGMVRPFMLQQSTKVSDLLDHLQDSIIEEEDAIAHYSYRGTIAGLRGFHELEKLYLHIRKEEEHHLKEFKDAKNTLRGG